MLDPQAAPGEVDAALDAASPAEIERIRQQLDMEVWWTDLRVRDARGRVEHFSGQHSGLDAHC
jgi:hypothetical protein